jgi:nicotinamide-nucleotide amidase
MEALAKKLGDRLKQRGHKLVTAESCTGGWLAQVITSIPGSSRWFERGFVTYSNESKQELLAVKRETLARCGAVSEETAREMAEGALRQSHAQIAIAITGIAGPEGGTQGKPVGTVWFAWAERGQPTRSALRCFAGDRATVRYEAVKAALEGLLERLMPL